MRVATARDISKILGAPCRCSDRNKNGTRRMTWIVTDAKEKAERVHIELTKRGLSFLHVRHGQSIIGRWHCEGDQYSQDVYVKVLVVDIIPRRQS